MTPHDYTVISIQGEYATLKDDDSAEELFISLFLLPDGTDIGTRLHYENLSYEIMDQEVI